MTVGELRAELADLPDGMEVMTDVYLLDLIPVGGHVRVIDTWQTPEGKAATERVTARRVSRADPDAPSGADANEDFRVDTNALMDLRYTHPPRLRETREAPYTEPGPRVVLLSRFSADHPPLAWTTPLWRQPTTQRKRRGRGVR